ncbi:MAG: hypothetical protein KDC00_04240 [Flavobacteriales bacterium]|nr:hypothetical protein [Flavobacteriales bacterium]
MSDEHTEAPMKRPYALLLSALFVLASLAQGPVRVIHLSGTDVVPVSAKKLFMVAVSELDPNGRISIDGHQVKVLIAAEVDPATVVEALNEASGGGSGLTLVSDVPEKAVLGLSTSVPVLIDTGDPEADEAVLRDAKQAWRNSDPAAHENHVRNLRQQPPAPHEE